MKYDRRHFITNLSIGIRKKKVKIKENQNVEKENKAQPLNQDTKNTFPYAEKERSNKERKKEHKQDRSCI